MAIINRVARLLKADLHAVIDHIEEPELQLRQANREMQEELDRTDSQIKHAQRDIDELNERKKNAEKTIKQVNEEVELCLANDNDELARGLLRKRLETAGHLQAIQTQLKHSNNALEELESQRQEQASLLESMRQKAELMVSSKFTSSHSSRTPSSASSVNDSDVEVALLKEKERLFAQKSNS